MVQEVFIHLQKIVEIINSSFKKFDVPEGILQYIPTKDRSAVGTLLKMEKYVDVLIPRGGRSLIERVIKESKVHVIRHLDGICHTYIHKSSKPKLCKEVTVNAKMRRPGICGATETILIDKDAIKSHLPTIIESLNQLNCEIRVEKSLLNLNSSLKLASNEDWFTEYLDKIISIKVITNGVQEAVEHINFYGSGHTDAILSEDKKAVDYFLNNVDSGIVMHNTSTQFADGGEFGMGAELEFQHLKYMLEVPLV